MRLNKQRKKAPSRLWWMHQAERAANIIRVGGVNEYITIQGTTSLFLPHSFCLPAYQPARLITCPHTEQLLSRLKGHGWGRGEILFLFTGIHFEKEMCWVSLLGAPRRECCPPPLLTAQPPSITLSLRQAVFFPPPVYLNIPVTSMSLCSPPSSLTQESLLLLDVSITQYLSFCLSCKMFPKNYITNWEICFGINTQILWWH